MYVHATWLRGVKALFWNSAVLHWFHLVDCRVKVCVVVVGVSCAPHIVALKSLIQTLHTRQQHKVLSFENIVVMS